MTTSHATTAAARRDHGTPKQVTHRTASMARRTATPTTWTTRCSDYAAQPGAERAGDEPLPVCDQCSDDNGYGLGLCDCGLTLCLECQFGHECPGVEVGAQMQPVLAGGQYKSQLLYHRDGTRGAGLVRCDGCDQWRSCMVCYGCPKRLCPDCWVEHVPCGAEARAAAPAHACPAHNPADSARVSRCHIAAPDPSALTYGRGAAHHRGDRGVRNFPDTSGRAERSALREPGTPRPYRVVDEDTGPPVQRLDAALLHEPAAAVGEVRTEGRCARRLRAQRYDGGGRSLAVVGPQVAVHTAVEADGRPCVLRLGAGDRPGGGGSVRAAQELSGSPAGAACSDGGAGSAAVARTGPDDPGREARPGDAGVLLLDGGACSRGPGHASGRPGPTVPLGLDPAGKARQAADGDLSAGAGARAGGLAGRSAGGHPRVWPAGHWGAVGQHGQPRRRPADEVPGLAEADGGAGGGGWAAQHDHDAHAPARLRDAHAGGGHSGGSTRDPAPHGARLARFDAAVPPGHEQAHAPGLRALAPSGFAAELTPVLPHGVPEPVMGRAS